MNNKRSSIKKDPGLTVRMFFTGLMLALAYVALFGLLLISEINYLFVMIFGVGMVFFQCFMSDKLVLMTTKAKVVSEEQYPELHASIERLSPLTDIPKPKNIGLMDMTTPNAFATRRSPKHAAVAVTTESLTRLTKDEMDVVIGHELAYVKNRDVMMVTWVSLIVIVAGHLMQILFWMSIFGGFGGNRREGGSQIVTLLMLVYVGVLVIYFISRFLLRALSRYRELAADRDGVLIYGPSSTFASVLRKISGQMASIPEKDLRQVEHPNAFFIIPALQGNAIASLMSRHSPTEERISKLMELERHNWHLTN